MFSNKDTVLESVEFSTAAVGCDISAFGRANYDKAFYDIRKKDGNFICNTYDAEGLRAELEEMFLQILMAFYLVRMEEYGIRLM